MTTVRVAGGRSLRGTIRVPGDKSISHRALLIGALASGESRIRGLSSGADVGCTRRALEALGIEIADDDRGTWVRGGWLRDPVHVLDVGNSGTSMRLLAGLLAGRGLFAALDGDDSLARRPMGRVVEPLRLMGAAIDGRDGGRFAPLVVRPADLHGIEYDLPVASAQVKSAVLLAGLAAEGDTVVREPSPTRAHTEELLAQAGADVTVDGSAVRVRRAERLAPLDLDIAGDPSQAAFWIVGACVTPGGDVTVEGIYVGRARGAFLDVLARMGADLEIERVGTTATVRARHSSLRGTEVAGDEVAGLIDEIPVLAVAAAVAEGETVFRDAAELRVKESDRVATVVGMLRAFGADAEPRDDGLLVAGGSALRAASVDAGLDHRIAMSAAIAGLVAAAGDTTIEGWGSVATSYPGFEEELERCAS